MTTRLGRAAYVGTDPFDCMGSEKNGSCRMLSCRVVSSMCELAFIRFNYIILVVSKDI